MPFSKLDFPAQDSRTPKRAQTESRGTMLRGLMLGSWRRTVALDGEKGENFFRRRVSGYARISAIFSAIMVVVHALAERPRRLPPRTEIAVAVALFAISVLNKRLGKTRRIVEVFDALTAIVACVGFALVLTDRSAEARPGLLVLLVATNVLVGRASLVPSTARRTFLLGVVALAPLLPIAFFLYGTAHAPDARARAAQVAGWAAVALTMSTLVSYRIHGLARKVEEARRLGQYTLEKKIGEGAMGDVYRARHALLRRPTALKVLRPSRNGEEDIRRFEREVQLTSELTHPNTIQIYDFGRADDGTFYYAMEWVDGPTLEDLVRTYGAQPASRVVRILADVCGSLAEAHDAGLVHRDVKPQNIMLCARGGLLDVVKVLDFGLVHSVAPNADVDRSTASRMVGTPMYMAPEAVVSPASVDARADLYAVGAVAYFLLAGAPIFEGQTLIALLGKHVYEMPEPLAERAPQHVPARLARLVDACLAKKPEDRPASAHAIRDELLAISEAIGDEEPTTDLVAWWQRYRETPKPELDLEASSKMSTRELGTISPARAI